MPLQDTIPSRHPPIATRGLILANFLVFVMELSLPERGLERVFYLFGIVPARFTHPAWAEWLGLPVDNYWPFLTSMFLHAGWFHLISNMWTLWIFGDNVEDRMGPVRFLLFYLLCGVAAGVVHVVFNRWSTVPTVGASGAIAGVMGAYFLLFPRSRVVVLMPLLFWPIFVEVPAVLYLGVWFASQFLNGAWALLGPGQVGGIAWWAHVGGFAAGMATFGLFLRRRRYHRRRQMDEWGWEGAWPPLGR